MQKLKEKLPKLLHFLKELPLASNSRVTIFHDTLTFCRQNPKPLNSKKRKSPLSVYKASFCVIALVPGQLLPDPQHLTMVHKKQVPRRSTSGPDELAKQAKKKQTRTRTQEPATFECQSPGCERKYVRKVSLTRHNKVDHVNGRFNSESQQQFVSNVEGQHNEELDNSADDQGVLPAVVPQPNGGDGDTAAAVEVYPGLPRPCQDVLEEHLLAREEKGQAEGSESDFESVIEEAEEAVTQEEKSKVVRKRLFTPTATPQLFDTVASEEFGGLPTVFPERRQIKEVVTAEKAAAEKEKEVGKEAKLKGLEAKGVRKSSKFGKASFMSDDSSSEEETSQEEEKKVEREKKKSKLEEKPRVADDKNTEVVTEVLQQLLTIAPRATVFRKAGESEPADNEVGKKDAAEALHGVNLEEVAKEDEVLDGVNLEEVVKQDDAEEKSAVKPVNGENTIALKTTVIRLFSGTKRPQDLPLPASSPKRVKADEEKQVEDVNEEGVAKVDDAEALHGVDLEEVAKEDEAEVLDDVTATQLAAVPPTQDLTRKLEGLVGLVESGSLSISLPALSRPSVIKLTPLSNRQNFKQAVPEFGDDGDGISDDDDDIEILD